MRPILERNRSGADDGRRTSRLTLAALLALGLMALVASGVWLGSSPSVATCVTAEGQRITLVAITEGGLEQGFVPGPRWRGLVGGLLPYKTADRLGLSGPMMSSSGPMPRQYWIRVPRGSQYEVSGIGPGGAKHVRLSIARITSTEADYHVVEFSGREVREIRLFKLGKNDSEDIIGVLAVR
jgi:hypothetical protein